MFYFIYYRPNLYQSNPSIFYIGTWIDRTVNHNIRLLDYSDGTKKLIIWRETLNQNLNVNIHPYAQKTEERQWSSVSRTVVWFAWSNTNLESTMAESSVKQQKEDDTDRISSLPDCILCHIMSFLPNPTITSVTTMSLVSRKWLHLWQQLHLWLHWTMLFYFFQNFTGVVGISVMSGIRCVSVFHRSVCFKIVLILWNCQNKCLNAGNEIWYQFTYYGCACFNFKKIDFDLKESRDF